MQAYDLAVTEPRAVLRIDAPLLTPQEEQQKWLAEAISAVEQKAAVMTRLMRTEEVGSRRTLAQVVSAAAAMLSELRTSMLSPHVYYELYVKVFDEMQNLPGYLRQHVVTASSPSVKVGRGRDEDAVTAEQLYERVQYTGHIIPRLYLLITVGALLLEDARQPALVIAQDLLEMCKGVQHPTRGLFLRHYFLTMMKDRLPGDVHHHHPAAAPTSSSNRHHSTPPAAATRAEGTALGAADLLIQNLKEMVWLWVRMEARGHATKPSLTLPVYQVRRVTQDRKELCVLVGMNVVRISQLEGIDRVAYQEEILPKLLSTILRFREPMAQHYLFEVIIQVFPDEYHLHTLDALLNGMRTLTQTVDVGEVMKVLMDRLGTYVLSQRAEKGGTAEEGEASTRHEEEADDEVIQNLFAVFLDKLEAMPISYELAPPALHVIKRTSIIPPPSPLPLVTYVTIMASLARLTERIDTPEHGDANVSRILMCLAEKFAAAEEAALEESHHGAAPLLGTNSASDGAAGSAPMGEKTAHPLPETDSQQPPLTRKQGLSAAAVAAAAKLVLHTLTQVNDVNRLLALNGLPDLIDRLPFASRRTSAYALMDTILPKAGEQPVTTLERVARLFDLLGPLLCDQSDAPTEVKDGDKQNPVATLEEDQQYICMAMHMFTQADPTVYLKMLTGVRKLLSQGGPRRMRHTFPTMAALYMRCALRIHTILKTQRQSEAEAEAAAPPPPPEVEPVVGGESAVEGDAESPHDPPSPTPVAEDVDAEQKPLHKKNDKPPPSVKTHKLLIKAFRHLYTGDGKGLLEVLATELPVPTFFTFLSCAGVADTCELPDLSYDLLTEALGLYEQYAADTRDQLDMLTCLINVLYDLSNIPAESYEVIATKVCQYGSKLVRKPDQSRLVALCANLFAKRGLPEENQSRVVECLQRALKIAHRVGAVQQLPLYVELLNVFLHFYASKHTPLSVDYVNRLIECIHEASEAQRGAPPQLPPTSTDQKPSGQTNDGSDSSDEDGPVGARPDLQGQTATDPSNEVGNAAYAEARCFYRTTTKYIRSRRSVDPQWEEVDV